MPTYEYRCRECGEELEAVQAFTDDPLTECPSCGGPLRKKFAAPGIAFKGSGFYKNDSRSSSSSGSSSSSDRATSTTSSTGGEAGSGGSGDGKADAPKPAAAAASSTGGSSSAGSAPTS